jgi:S1/P1 Nuclease
MFRTAMHAFVLCVVLSTFCFPALGWDSAGHKVVAYVAWQQMTPAVREKVIKILRSAPEDSGLAAFYMPYGSQSVEARQREFFMIAATWADMIKDKDFDVRNKKYSNSNWHYFDTLWTDKGGKVVILPAGNEGGHMMEKMADFDKVIRSNASNEEKAIAIAWLEHLIGDLHQPLHTTARVLGGDNDKGDQGGNLFSLRPKGSKDRLNLHSFWDEILEQTSPNKADLCEGDYLSPIGDSIIKEFPYATLQSRLADNKYDSWEKESVDIAATQIYKDIKRYEDPSDKYKKKALNIARERIALAGYRLADLFNEVFGNQLTDGKPSPVVP